MRTKYKIKLLNSFMYTHLLSGTKRNAQTHTHTNLTFIHITYTHIDINTLLAHMKWKITQKHINTRAQYHTTSPLQNALAIYLKIKKMFKYDTHAHTKHQ